MGWSFIDCFTKDLKARGERISLKEILRRLVFDVGYRAVVYYRLSVFFGQRRLLSPLGRLIRVRLMRVPGVEIRTKYEIGEGLRMYHPHDIVIGAGAKIGKRVTIYNGVTLGARIIKELDDSQLVESGDRYPTIEDDVVIFSGAKIIGRVTIGARSIVGANSVVNKSFPPDSIVAGVPARLVGTRTEIPLDG